MSLSTNPDDRERALRIELGERTVDADARPEDTYQNAGDSPYVRKVGDEISKLMREGYLEEARTRLVEELAKAPDELRFLNLQTLLEIYDRTFNDFEAARKYACLTLEKAIEKDNGHYIRTSLIHTGIIAQYEGHSQYSLAMYLAAHFINKKAIVPMQNLAGWYARREKLENAQDWINQIINAFPDWLDNAEIKNFFIKDESLRNLRTYKPFVDNVLLKIEGRNSPC